MARTASTDGPAGSRSGATISARDEPPAAASTAIDWYDAALALEVPGATRDELAFYREDLRVELGR